jgi:hypothetical protein
MVHIIGQVSLKIIVVAAESLGPRDDNRTQMKRKSLLSRFQCSKARKGLKCLMDLEIIPMNRSKDLFILQLFKSWTS